jgi:hypothetical protein
MILNRQSAKTPRECTFKKSWRLSALAVQFIWSNKSPRRTIRAYLLIMRTLFLSIFTVSTLMAAERFGFLGPEIFPVGRGIDNLRQADLDGDGRRDLVLVNNLRSKITLLYNRTGGKPTKVTEDTVNALPPDARFRIESIPSEKRIASLVVADLNGDKKPGLAYYGAP